MWRGGLDLDLDLGWGWEWGGSWSCGAGRGYVEDGIYGGGGCKMWICLFLRGTGEGRRGYDG